MSKTSFLDRAADFLATLDPSSVHEEAIAAAHDALVDYFGVALGGASEPVADKVFAWASERSFGTTASVLRRNIKLDVENAALCNAVAGHALDFDDTSWRTIGHPTTVVAPAALAVGESIGASGRDVLVAYLAGVEVAHRLADLSMPNASENGWHTTAIFYTLGAAAAACVLLRLDEDQIVNALSLAVSRSSGVRANFGTPAKPYHAGMAARNGLEAVSLARAGLTSSVKAVDGTDGFLRCFAGTGPFESASSARITFGEPFDLVARGVAFKRFPCCSGSHPACDLILDMAEEHDIQPSDVVSVDVGVSLLAKRELVCHAPKTPVEARFSLEFVVAAALARRAITLDTFLPDVLSDPDIRRLMSCVHMKLDDELAQLGFIGTAPAKIKIAIKDGRVLEGSRDIAVGNPERPFSKENVAEKFLMCARRSMDEASAIRAFELVSNLASWKNVANGLAEISECSEAGRASGGVLIKTVRQARFP
jgi:2-methylcitrate dehydratase PrpD